MAWFTEFRADDEVAPYMICFFATLKYRLADGSTLGIEQGAAWCDKCGRFGAAEIIPSIEELCNRLKELQTPTTNLYVIYRTEEAINRAIGELRTRLKWRATRKSLARCLSCCSIEIEPIHFDEGRACAVHGRRLLEIANGFADTADWIAEYSPEGLTLATLV